MLFYGSYLNSKFHLLLNITGIKLTQTMSGSIPIQQYFGRIMQESKTDIPVSTALIIFGAVKFLVGKNGLLIIYF